MGIFWFGLVFELVCLFVLDIWGGGGGKGRILIITEDQIMHPSKWG